MSWAAISGQLLAVRLFRQAAATGKVSHAYLLVGPDGVGKRSVALQLVKVLNCSNSDGQGNACDQCPSCKKLEIWPPVHPDLVWIRPEGRQIKTEQIALLQSEMYARPHEGRVKVALIDEVDRLNQVSGNRLLKLLEEPPSYGILLLLTQNLSAILPTIISRCQVVNFPPLSPEVVTKALCQQHGLPSDQAQLFGLLSGGSLGRALAMAQDPVIAQRRTESLELLEDIAEMDDVSLLAYAEALEKKKDQVDDWLEMLTVWLRDATLITQAAPLSLIVNADRTAAIRSLAERYGADSLLALLAAVTDARFQLQRNANTRLALDLLLLRFAHQLSGSATSLHALR